MINTVVSGDFQGKKIKVNKTGMFIGNITINKETVDHYEVMNENIDTTTFTKGKTKKSMVGAGTKGAVGAVIGTAIAPGIGTLIGAGAGVATSKGKTKSKSTEITKKELLVAIYFANDKESLVKMDGITYEQFLINAFKDPTLKITNANVNKDKTNNKDVWKALGWFLIPFIMTPVFWRKLAKPQKIVGVIWSIVVISIIITNR